MPHSLGLQKGPSRISRSILHLISAPSLSSCLIHGQMRQRKVLGPLSDLSGSPYPSPEYPLNQFCFSRPDSQMQIDVLEDQEVEVSCIQGGRGLPSLVSACGMVGVPIPGAWLQCSSTLVALAVHRASCLGLGYLKFESVFHSHNSLIHSKAQAPSVPQSQMRPNFDQLPLASQGFWS